MIDKNIVLLDGIIGDGYGYGKTQEGKEFATFCLILNNNLKEYTDSTSKRHYETYIRIFVYEKRLVEYLKDVGAHRGNRVSVFGRLSSCKNERKGITFMTLNVVCRDIEIIKTKQ